MRLSRFYLPLSLSPLTRIDLPKEVLHYMLNVLRLREGDKLRVFNGEGGEYDACLVDVGKKNARLHVGEWHTIERESPLKLTLVQAISRTEHMDYALQKAVELGVNTIVPIMTERSVRLDPITANKRAQHWQKILISACEQSGRNRLPTLHAVTTLENYLSEPLNELAYILSPTAHYPLPLQLETPPTTLRIVIGAEGGFTTTEVNTAEQAGYKAISLGSRILRTETATITILAICQALYGDLA
ncbi:RNA methyltransferase, RsmE family [Beggiatoa alba B18LD]|uniref:Ribosomal RNA small subunit methyltransferase E n=1 Tax=Beggiatoa alba B18LD TaxID=395493 RepID=I3CKR6_9GAMM|nr:16S rRNA (uracil(1498)-N(3))-methyltransferase [Beggiatoa alba]EIJ44209.1 RNA methyltransferase, RsmE family [Beggiatoa alba B18LD]